MASHTGDSQETQERRAPDQMGKALGQAAALPLPAEDTIRNDDTAPTARLHDAHESAAKTLSPERPETEYGGSMANRKSSSGFLASLTASNISSPLQSTYASSASLQSSSDPAAGQVNLAHAADLLAANATHDSRPQSPSHAHPKHAVMTAQLQNALWKTSPKQHDRPHYPDQSHAALHSQIATLPYEYLKARNSDYGEKDHSSGSPARSTDRLSTASASRSVDNTPLQSPSLFQLKPTVEPAIIQPSGPSFLHHTHREYLTKETNKLIKDFDQVTGNKIMNDYEVLEKLGVGSYGAVKHARNLVSNQDVAIKILRRTGRKGRLGKHTNPENKIKMEVAVLKKARHPQIVSLLEVIDDPESQKVYLVLEYVERGEIIWRTETTHDIARFEMQRVGREWAGAVNEEREAELVTRFNVEAEAKRLEQLEAASRPLRARAGTDRLVDEQIRIGKSPNAGLVRLPTSSSSSNDLVYGWSNEVGGNESDVEREERADSTTRHTRHASAKPLETPRPFDAHKNTRGWEEFPDLAAALSGFQSGPYDSPDENWTAEEGDFRYVPCMTMAQARDAFRDTVLGLEYLHYHGIIHRDIKPANLLWTKEYRVKISDFGVSYVGEPIRISEHEPSAPGQGTYQAERELAKTVGTPAFFAPELCDPEKWGAETSEERYKVTAQIDIWALGVTLYAMIYGRLPFFDENDEFGMYERIARQEAFFSSKRLKGVRNTELPTTEKRPAHLIEYEEVDEVLQDLLHRLLIKDPTKRATLVEIKHHPWVLFGLEDPEWWARETDPALRSDKIQVSNNEVEVAIAPLNLVDRIKHGIRRLGSVVTRGRESRRRAESSVKDTSGSASSRSTTMDRDARRPSLRGDEQIYTALRASREAHEHPLSQSVVASPAIEKGDPMLVAPIAHLEIPDPASGHSFSHSRPAPVERHESASESIRTLRGYDAARGFSVNEPIEEDHHGPQLESAASSSSGLSNLIGVASRRLASKVRRDRANSSRENSDRSSRSSSVENMAAHYDHQHAFPSVALSPAVAAGQVDHDFFGTETGGSAGEPGHAHEPHPASRPRNESSPSTFPRTRSQNFRRMVTEHHAAAHAPHLFPDRTSPCPPSPEARSHARDFGGGRSRGNSLRGLNAPQSPGIPPLNISTAQPDQASTLLETAETITASTYAKHKDAPIPASAAAARHVEPTWPMEASTAARTGDAGDASTEAHGGESDDDDDDDDEGIVMGGLR